MEHKFTNINAAKGKAAQLARKYGYRPEVFKVTNPRTRKTIFVVVEPKGLTRI